MQSFGKATLHKLCAFNSQRKPNHFDNNLLASNIFNLEFAKRQIQKIKLKEKNQTKNVI